jgi:hypothetical protein
MSKKKAPLPALVRVQTEQGQAHATRAHLFSELEVSLGRPVVTFFTSFRYPVMIEDNDADMLEGVLRDSDLTNGLALCISSPGGDGLAAERIINVCRSYSKTGEYTVIVPGKAKSAATMVCFGASKILMGPTSELGPIDPQIASDSDNRMIKRYSVFNIVEGYKNLFDRAVKEKRGNLQPYLQQLANYDEKEIKEFQSALDLSDDIAVRALESGMMKGDDQNTIRERIKTFLSPTRTKVHGRAIYRAEADGCGLNVEAIEPTEAPWELIYELYIRTNNFVSTRVLKCIEGRDHSFIAPVGEN